MYAPVMSQDANSKLVSCGLIVGKKIPPPPPGPIISQRSYRGAPEQLRVANNGKLNSIFASCIFLRIFKIQLFCSASPEHRPEIHCCGCPAFLHLQPGLLFASQSDSKAAVSLKACYIHKSHSAAHKNSQITNLLCCRPTVFVRPYCSSAIMVTNNVHYAPLTC